MDASPPQDPAENAGFVRAVFWLLLASCIAQAIFATLPAIDIWVSAWFYDAGDGFALRHAPGPVFVRKVLIESVLVAGWAALFLALMARFGHGPYRLGWRPWAFVVLTLVLGPGVFINGVLKSFWGRARPENIAEFGGTATFTPAFQFADQCATNCSFPAGEAAGLITLVMLILVLAWPRATRRNRAGLVAVLVPIGLVGGALRVMMGRHFLSDVVFAILISGFFVVVLHRIMGVGRVGGVGLTDLAADLRTMLRDVGGGAVRGLGATRRAIIRR